MQEPGSKLDDWAQSPTLDRYDAFTSRPTPRAWSIKVLVGSSRNARPTPMKRMGEYEEVQSPLCGSGAVCRRTAVSEWLEKLELGGRTDRRDKPGILNGLLKREWVRLK